jgi:hypothetical protein
MRVMSALPVLCGLTALVVLAALLSACGQAGSGRSRPAPANAAPIPSSLLSQARPVGTGPRFSLSAAGPVSGPCRAALGSRAGLHVEVFAANQVLLLPAGIGTRPPRSTLDGRITAARCYGSLVTLDPTGVVLVRPGAALTLGTLFRAWGVPLTRTRLASFTAAAGTQVEVYVDGKRWTGEPGRVPLTRHAEIVAEVGPLVPPHASYVFPAGL